MFVLHKDQLLTWSQQIAVIAIKSSYNKDKAILNRVSIFLYSLYEVADKYNGFIDFVTGCVLMHNNTKDKIQDIINNDKDK